VATNEVEEPGAEPSSRSLMLLEAAESLAPVKSIERIEATARGVIAGTAATATVIVGFGAFGQADLLAAPLAVVPSVLFTALAMGCAAWALVPKVGKLGTGNLDVVEDYYENEIGRRGLWARRSAILLALSYVSAAVPLLLVGPKTKTPTVAVRFDPTAKAKGVEVSSSLGEVDAGTRATLAVVEVNGRSRRFVTSVTQDQTEDKGDLSVKLTVAGPQPGRSLEATLRIKNADGVVKFKTVSLFGASPT